VLSFLISTPTTGVDSIFATYSLLGPLFAIFRPIAALIMGVVVGIADFFVEGKEHIQPISKHKCEKKNLLVQIKSFFSYAFIEIPRDIGKWLIIGTIIGAAISTFMPEDIFSKYIAFPFDFLVALVVGIPLYVCSMGSIPIAASLILKGISPGAALVFLIAGPATNAVTLAFIRAKLGKKSLYIYLFCLIIISLVIGLIFNYMWELTGKSPQLITGAGKMLSFDMKLAAGVIMLVLIMNAFIRQFLVLRKGKPKTEKCPHCEEEK